MWIDAPDALRRVDRLHEDGRIDDTEALALESLVSEGFAVIRNAVPAALLDAAWRSLDLAVQRGVPLTCHKEGVGLFLHADACRLGLEAGPFSVHDGHEVSDECLAVASHPAVTSLLVQLFDGLPMLMQSQMLRFGSGKGTHTDFAHCPVVSPLRTATVWIAAEQANAGNGALYVYRRSHRLPLHRFENGCVLWPHGEDTAKLRRYHDSLERQCLMAGLERRTFMAEAGDLLLMHPRLAHGALTPVSRGAARRSLTLHVAAPGAYACDHRPSSAGSILRQAGQLCYYKRTLS